MTTRHVARPRRRAPKPPSPRHATPWTWVLVGFLATTVLPSPAPGSIPAASVRVATGAAAPPPAEAQPPGVRIDPETLPRGIENPWFHVPVGTRFVRRTLVFDRGEHDVWTEPFWEHVERSGRTSVATAVARDDWVASVQVLSAWGAPRRLAVHRHAPVDAVSFARVDRGAAMSFDFERCTWSIDGRSHTCRVRTLRADVDLELRDAHRTRVRAVGEVRGCWHRAFVASHPSRPTVWIDVWSDDALPVALREVVLRLDSDLGEATVLVAIERPDE